MRYIYDNDLHVHSKLSLCSNDEGQSTERLLEYAKENGIKTICVTDHFWDQAVEGASSWYGLQNMEHISQSKPLPQSEGIRFLFGCETEFNKHFTLGISKECFDNFDFVVIPTTHLHMVGFTISEEDAKSTKIRARLWVERLERVLNMDLPFHKIGLAHLTCPLLAPKREEYLEVLNLIAEEDMVRLFTKAAKLGVGIELNQADMEFKDEETDTVLRMYKIAKKCGCKFYIGSDAHHPEQFEKSKRITERAIDLLELTEDDKFRI